MRSRSSVVAPDRRPWPCSARRTQWRSVSPEQPIFSAIEWIADHWEVCSAWWSRTIRTARARTSGEYGGTRFVMAPSSQESEPPENPVRFIGPLALDWAAQEGLHPPVDLAAQSRDLTFGDALHPHGPYQIVTERVEMPWT